MYSGLRRLDSSSLIDGYSAAEKAPRPHTKLGAGPQRKYLLFSFFSHTRAMGEGLRLQPSFYKRRWSHRVLSFIFIA